MDKIDLLPEVVFTPTQQRIFDVLCDGEPHKPQELLDAIDTLASRDTLSFHLANLRAAIYESGYLIAGHTKGYSGVIYYQLVGRLRIIMD